MKLNVKSDNIYDYTSIYFLQLNLLHLDTSNWHKMMINAPIHCNKDTDIVLIVQA
jgi:predicted cupin superfamily sugar epimerase